MNEPTRKNCIAELERRCAAQGRPLTSQRRAIMDVVAGRTDHPTVDQIHTAVATRLPEISRATVYRSLETLLGLGLLRRVDHPGSAVRFDANTEPHHHFLCMECGAISDLAMDAVEGHGDLAYAGAEDLVVQEMAILLRGTCAACREPA